MRDRRLNPKGPGQPARLLLERWILRGRLTQGEAAAQIGVSRVKLNQYLNAEAKPSLEMAIRIEDATGISIRSWLIHDPQVNPVTDGSPAPSDVPEGVH